MNQAQALKNLMENGTSIEYFSNGYIMQVKDKIKVYEEGKKSARTLTQAQQTKLLLEARGGGQTKQSKHATKRQIERIEDEEDETSLNDRKFIQEEQLTNDYDEDDDQTIVEQAMKFRREPSGCEAILPAGSQPRQTQKQTPKKIIKKPQLNYTSPQVDLEELIRLRTENSFIKQQHQDSVKQIEKYKAKIKSYKSKKYQEEQPLPIPVQEQEQATAPARRQIASDFEQQEQVQEIQFKDCDLI
ncbi:MAG: hypothetical protein EZS28_005646 [Streblomastix strix]|uniref:Uncharacterized protein n=1 Tax=Streblomastix strix TaxID=222440 RepID=A0A5J4WV21_9EUKA|nr:MAG: hypothetical protein EZS28_005646 [Streblomastix strix]